MGYSLSDIGYGYELNRKIKEPPGVPISSIIDRFLSPEQPAGDQFYFKFKKSNTAPKQAARCIYRKYVFYHPHQGTINLAH